MMTDFETQNTISKGLRFSKNPVLPEGKSLLHINVLNEHGSLEI